MICNICRSFRGRFLALALCTVSVAQSRGEFLPLIPIADTTLIEAAPDNNLGGQMYFNVGTTEHFTRNRGLLRFDLSSIPYGSTLKTASLTLEVVHEPNNGFEPSEMALHRMLTPWGEGNKSALTSPGLGTPATSNEATWNSPFAFTTESWASPGGAPGTNYMATATDSVFVYGVTDSPYVFSSTNLLQDLQLWMNNPSRNFGWMLLTTAEDSKFTARRIGSREDSGSEPLLQIEYSAPLILLQPETQNTLFTFQFDALAGSSYTAEYIAEFGNPNIPWQTLTNFTAPAFERVTISDSIVNEHRFYRVRVP